MKYCSLILIFVILFTCKTLSKSVRSNKILSQLELLKELIEKRSYSKSINNRRNVQCKRLGNSQLLMQYKAQSGYDSVYVGSTIRDAVLFPNLLWDINKRRLYMDLLNGLKSTIDNVENISDVNIVLKVKNAIAKRINVTTTQVTGVLPNNTKQKRGLDDSRISSIPVGNCTRPGDIDPATTNVYLCEQCAMTTTLSDDRFPRYVNEIVCGGKGKTCFQGDGTCKQNKRLVHFLKRSNECRRVIENGVEVLYEKWDLVREEIRISCECQLKTHSKMIGLL